MRFSVDRDEWYPVYGLYEHQNNDGIFDLPEDKIAWIRKTFEEFDKVQGFLSQMYKESPARMCAAAEAAFKVMEETFGGKSKEGWKHGDDTLNDRPIRWTTIECPACGGQKYYDQVIYRFLCTCGA